MNIYDKRQVRCVTCGKPIGEVDDDARILFSRCGVCTGMDSGENEVSRYLTDRFENTVKSVLVTR